MQENKALNLHTVNDILCYAERQFLTAKLHFGHGTDNAWDEAVVLVLHVLDLPIDSDGDTVKKRQLTDGERERMLSLIDRRVNERVPAPYLTHEAWFFGLSFYVDERVLIPRSPLAELIEQAFSPWIEEDQIESILDMGTGSACIACACALTFPDAKVDAVDLHPQALEVAQINVGQHDLLTQVNLIQSDLFTELADKKYDIIISNPPYVDEQDMMSLPQEYRHEPDHALASGNDGLNHVKAILRSAPDFLNDGGILVVEVGNSREALEHLLPRAPFVWLEFEHGGEGVFLLTKEELCLPCFKSIN
ncbi:MAG: 50S ribosomal protein L3 N(5)-glutamine methyltransferase [Pseudomonadota bacterium]